MTMLKKIILISSILICLFFAGISGLFAQVNEEQSDFDRLIEINLRITPEYLQKFAEERGLVFTEIKEKEDIYNKLSKKKSYDISFQEQKQVGNKLLKEFFANQSLYLSDPLIVKYIASVGKLVSSHMDEQEGTVYTYGIINDPAIRIYTFPGGYIFVTRGFLKAVENEAQLAASLAREIGGIDQDLQLETLAHNQESFSLLTSLIKIINKTQTESANDLNKEEVEIAKKPFSDPFDTLDYYAAPSTENMFSNEQYLTRKLLKKILTLIPAYETIVKKDLISIEALKKAGYDTESVKDLLIVLNKAQPQPQVINRTMNIENWLGAESLKKKRSNKVEGRYLMMVERLEY